MTISSAIKEIADAIRLVQGSKLLAQVMFFRLFASSGEKMSSVFFKAGFRMCAKECLDQVLKAHFLPWFDCLFKMALPVIQQRLYKPSCLRA